MAYNPNELRDPEGSDTGGQWTSSPAMGSASPQPAQSTFSSERLFKGTSPAVKAKFDQISRVLSKLVGRTGRETAVIMAPDGALSEVVHGDESSVSITERMRQFVLQNDGAEFHHSHPDGEHYPGGQSISSSDLLSIVDAGINSIVAHTPDGSIFQAAITTSWLDRFDWETPGRAAAVVANRLLPNVFHPTDENGDYIPVGEIFTHELTDPFEPYQQEISEPLLAHMMNIELRDRGIIDYRFKLSDSTRAAFERALEDADAVDKRGF